ncbi:MAG TPA: MOSC domain-containing protein [Candidatus Eremiobacteraceae bacterium]|jgi:MOSC domain-containing protein YiiM|nr:MOSC domain-containing protein [Candidatus Eremiobacteraceae bacterium]
MKMVSMNVGLPREVQWHGHAVTTGIFKSPTSARIRLRKLNLDGDRQADLTVHGGEHKAVYCYPAEHYAYWKKRLPGRDLPFGAFGENFTTEGMLEENVRVGDRFAINDAEVVVTQPRLPCYKLGIRFQADDMVKKFLASRRIGFYVAVTREGEVAAFDEIIPVTHNGSGVSIADFLRLFLAKQFTKADATAIRQLSELSAVPEDWKSYFRDRLQTAGIGS